jgi:glutaminyl-tRNA synthetase
MQAVVVLSLEVAFCDFKFQFERHGYFVADRVDHAAGDGAPRIPRAQK